MEDTDGPPAGQARTGRGDSRGSQPAGEADDSRTAPETVLTAGEAGVYLAGGSLVLAVVGLLLARLGLQPFGNVLTVFALLGVTVAMVLGALFHAYTAEYGSDGSV